MQALLTLLEHYGLWLVFANVLLLQFGLPLPAYPTLIVTSALSATGAHSPLQIVAVAAVACLIADLAWYATSKRYGRRMLGLLCRISLSPDSCVRQTESIYERWGAPSLLVARFIPGFAAIATAMAGIVRTRLALFVPFVVIGATLWSGVAVALGWIFRDAVADVLDVLEQAGRVGLAAIGAAFVLFVLLKAWQRRQFRRQLRMARVSVNELNDLLQRGERPLIIDVRSLASRNAGRIPGALWLDSHALDASLRQLPAADEVIVYCACPNEASAAALAKQLIRHGFARVRPLHGGIDAWIAAGLPLETGSEAQPPRHGVSA
jgi:membrane protein DedA with SNARE-associated domain/rhodanese-related sulfurtransferase